MLGASGDLEPLDACLPQLVVERRLQLEDALLARCPLGGYLERQVPIVFRFKKLERQILQLRFDACHTEAVRQRSVDLPSLERDAGATLGGEMLQGSHVVQPIA